MEKSIFLFKRHAQRTRADFGHHYINHHAPLGKKLCRCLLGYTVNLVESDSEIDAVTENWLPKVSDLLTPSITYASQADFEAVLVDDQSLFSGFQLYVVTEEKIVTAGEPLDSPLGSATPETKTVLLYSRMPLPPPPSDARRVVDNIVSHKLFFNEQGEICKMPSDIAVFRMIWAEGNPVADARERLNVKEYRQIAAPAWLASA